MERQKSTKKALLSSILSLVLCLSMLIGTTFAWFTDSVTSANNIIKSGNLDIELYYQNDTVKEWTKVTDSTNIFKADTLWEPGHTEVVKLKVENNGSLALKYQFGINVASETGSINKDGKEFKLSDYIYFGVADGVGEYTRESAVAAVKDSAVTVATGITKANSLEANKAADEMTLVVYMPETVGNEANYQEDAAVPTINLGLNLFATQYTSEADSFDNQYDAYATDADYIIDTQEELDAALAQASSGETIAIADGTYNLNRQVNGVILVGMGTDVNLYNTNNYASNGSIGALTKKMTYMNLAFTNTVWTQNDGAYATFDGVTFEQGFRNGYSRDVSFVNCTFFQNSQGYAMHFGEVYEKLTVTKSTFYMGKVAMGDDGEGLVIFDECEFVVDENATGVDYSAWVDVEITNSKATMPIQLNMQLTEDKSGYHTAEIQNTQNIAAVCGTLSESAEGLSVDTAGNYYVYSATGLANLRTWMGQNFNNTMWNKTYNIMANINAENVTWETMNMSPDSSDFNGITFNGNGYTISNLVIEGNGLFSRATQGTADGTAPSVFKNITFDNVTVTGSAHHNGLVWGEVVGDITLENVSVINSTVSGGCNVGALIGRNSESHAVIKFVDCAVKNTTVKATQVADYAGASAFLGMALHIGTSTSANVIFEGNNVAEGNTLDTAAGMQGGGIYTIAEWGASTWEKPTVVNDFTNYNSND